MVDWGAAWTKSHHIKIYLCYRKKVGEIHLDTVSSRYGTVCSGSWSRKDNKTWELYGGREIREGGWGETYKLSFVTHVLVMMEFQHHESLGEVLQRCFDAVNDKDHIQEIKQKTVKGHWVHTVYILSNSWDKAVVIKLLCYIDKAFIRSIEDRNLKVKDVRKG